jgi:hypothetical protein
MREIKFRVFDENHRCIHYSDNCTLDWLFDLPKRHGGAIMQFIGLHDKNGKEIYEGDIVSTKEGVRRVVFTAPSFTLDPSYDDGDYYIGSFSEAWKWSEFEVIGNIYENPDLLKG